MCTDPMSITLQPQDFWGEGGKTWDNIILHTQNDLLHKRKKKRKYFGFQSFMECLKQRNVRRPRMETCFGNLSCSYELANSRSWPTQGCKCKRKDGLEWTLKLAFSPSFQIASRENSRICASNAEAPPTGNEPQATTLHRRTKARTDLPAAGLSGFTQTWSFNHKWRGAITGWRLQRTWTASNAITSAMQRYRQSPLNSDKPGSIAR